MTKLTKAGLEMRKRKLMQRLEPEFKIKDWSYELKTYLPHFGKIWDKTTIDQKVKFVKGAKLDHIFKINSVTGDLPNWKDFETNHQQLLRDAIRRIIE